MLNIVWTMRFKTGRAVVRLNKPVENYIGYARVSTEEQSLTMQVEALVQFGVLRSRVVEEKVSGAASKRPMLDQILEGLRPGDVLVVWRLDRLGRDMRDLLDKMALIESLGADFKSVTENFDLRTPAGRMHMQFSMMMAENERNITIERTREGVKQAIARGVQFGQQPKLSVEERKQAQKLRDGGMSIRAIAVRFGCSHNTIRNWTSGVGRKRVARKSPK
jgi:DNA invertase Pin-like site-specific DNA recombinase